jgi:hypothetical protein
MMDPRDIVRLINPHMAKVLTIGEAALPGDQFTAFRKLVLEEFGGNGLGKELYEHFGKHQD